MSRRLFTATAVAVVYVLSSNLKAADVSMNRSSSCQEIRGISTEAAEFFRETSDQSNTGTVSIGTPTPQNICLVDQDGSYLQRALPVQLLSPTPLTQRQWLPPSDAQSLDSDEMPLVPLPPPVWTGAAGLAGLAVVRVGRTVRKQLRSM